jgi:hypothetical protein
MIVVLLVAAVLFALGTAMMTAVTAEVNRSALGNTRSASYQAAESGVEDYVAKLTEDHSYYLHYVHPAESTRRDSTGTLVAAGATWAGGVTWTYPNNRDAWRSLGNGYEFNLQISPPNATNGAVKVRSTGRRQGSTIALRTVEVLVRPASIADFQMISNRDVSYGSTATTRGKLYAGIDETGRAHSISHAGTAYGNLYAEASILQAPTYMNGARGYNSSNIRTVVKNPVNFNSFTSSLVDIRNEASLPGGILLDNASVHAWRLTFNSTGTVTIASCQKVGSSAVGQTAPTCTTTSTVTLGAVRTIYTNQTAIVVGAVKGMVTVASNADMIIGGATTYVTPGTDVLGLIAKNDLIVPQWAPNNLTWWAATVAQTGQWRSWSSDGSHGTMTFNGSTATALGGYMDMFDVRNYNYDVNLQTVQPPHFPVLEEAYTVLLFREVNP